MLARSPDQVKWINPHWFEQREITPRCTKRHDLDTAGMNTESRDVSSHTPMMAQYLRIKAQHPDTLLFYRMGDFYELFFEDAEKASRALGIVLTKRGKHQGQDIPMCGVPVSRSDECLHRLIALGHRVAVCEQLEDPAEAKKRGYKSVVRRDVVRLVTPGTLTEDTLLDAKRNNYLLAIARLWRAKRALALRGSTFRPANSASPNATAFRSRLKSRGWSRAKFLSPTLCTVTSSRCRYGANCRR